MANIISKVSLPNGTTYETRGIHQVIGTQTASTGSWTGKIDVAELFDGLTIAYFLPYAGSGNATLNLTLSGGGTTGAVNCYYGNTTRLTTHYSKGSNIIMTYWSAGSIKIDGTATTDNRWIASANFDSNSQAYEIRDFYNRFKAGANKVFPYTIIMQCADDRWESIVTSSSTGTSKTRNTHGFKLGQIALMYANATYNENATIGDATIYEAYNSGLVDHRYSFNTANNSTSGTTAVKPVYLVGALNATDGLFYLDTTWWTQTLPTTDDGKLYIYLGDAYDYYRMSFVIRHPIYWYKNGAVRQFTQDSATVTGHTVAKDVPSSANFNDTTYGISVDGANIKLTAGGTGTTAGLSDLINGLGEGSSPAQLNDYLVAQYAGGGSTTKTYHRRAVKNVVNKTVVDNALGKGSDTTKYYRNDGSWTVPPDTKVTSSSNHYTPATASGQDKTASASGASAAWSIDVVKGVTLNTDGKGHVTGLSVTSGKIPAKPSYSAADVGAIPTSSKGAANGVAELDANGLVPTSQLPSFVDDVLEYSSKSAFPATGETGKIYVALDTNLTYRWSGTAYVEISPSLALGETSSTAYRGDRGKVAYDHSQSTHARTDATAVSFTRNLTSGTKVGTITINGTGTDLYCQTNTDHYHTSGTWSNLKYTATAKNSAEELSFTLPTGTTATTVALGNHTHTTSIAASTGTNQLTLAHGSKYAITAGGTSFVFTMPTDNNTDTKVSQALVSDNVNRPLLMACANNTDKTATITDASRRANSVYANASTGTITANKYNVTTNATIQYNSTTQSLDFVFA